MASKPDPIIGNTGNTGNTGNLVPEGKKSTDIFPTGNSSLLPVRIPQKSADITFWFIVGLILPIIIIIIFYFISTNNESSRKFWNSIFSIEE
jgi:hypothetical protein